MKILDLDFYHVTTLEESEATSLNGGWIALAIALVGAGIYIYNNASDFVAGFKEGYKSVN
ncbi:MAG: hypothetical protein JXR41_11080 [Bacteroidales bacterium]|nr:hypothetical protein [Bacteroidales bacterium]